MTVRTLFFASYRDLVGAADLMVDLPPNSTVAELVERLRTRGEPFERLPTAPAVAVNREYAPLETPLADGDEVAFIPPVAGG